MSFSGEQPSLTEVKIAKKYLNEKELKALNQIVEGYLAFAERQAERQIPMKMVEWAKHLDNILTMTGEDLLSGKGKISHLKAIEKAEKDYLDIIKELENKINDNDKK